MECSTFLCKVWKKLILLKTNSSNCERQNVLTVSKVGSVKNNSNRERRIFYKNWLVYVDKAEHAGSS